MSPGGASHRGDILIPPLYHDLDNTKRKEGRAIGIRPVPESFRITQFFSENLTSYNTGAGHGAFDYATPVGTEAVAIADGVVVFSDWAWNLPAASWESRWYLIRPPVGVTNVGGGILTVVRHDDVDTVYAHLSDNNMVKPGQVVKQGQVVGLTGNTGSSTGPHLHLQVLPRRPNYLNGFYGSVSPAPYTTGKYFKLNPFTAPDLSGSTMNGIDVSNWQAGINLANVPADFVIVLATDGAGFTNPHLVSQVNQALKLGKRVGVYHFARVAGSANSDVEAKHFLSRVKRWKGRVLPILDWEPPSQGHRTDYADAWMRRVEAEMGTECLIYMNLTESRRSNWSAYAKSHGLWLASYALGEPTFIGYAQTFTKPATPGWRLVLWQYTQKGKLPGYAGDLDLNVAFGDPWKRPTGYGTATKTKDWFAMATEAQLRKIVAEETKKAVIRELTWKREKLGGAGGKVSIQDEILYAAANHQVINKKLDALVDGVTAILDRSPGALELDPEKAYAEIGRATVAALKGGAA